MAAAQPTGLPPNVLPCVPGVMHWQQCVTAHIDGDSALTFIMGQSQRAALTGYTPPLSACSKTLSFASTLSAIKDLIKDLTHKASFDVYMNETRQFSNDVRLGFLLYIEPLEPVASWAPKVLSDTICSDQTTAFHFCSANCHIQ